MKRIGYTRVSTNRQTTFQAEDQLRANNCDEIYTDFAVSAVAKKRPGLMKATSRLKPGDVFVVLAIDRAFRSTIEGLLFLDELQKDGVKFHSIYQNIDTTTPEGRKWFTYSVADAEYERAVISRRTKEKMAAAKRRGVKFGRKSIMSRQRKASVHRLLGQGLSVGDTATEIGVSRSTVYRHM